MNVVIKTNIGCARSENQDRVKAVMLNDDVALAVLCDGMGGENAGSEASQIAVDIVYDRISGNFRHNSDENNIKNLLVSSVSAANSVIYNKANEENEKAGMGTTCVAALVTKNTIHILNVGDSRAYLIDSNGIKQVTSDHTFVKMLFDQGKIQEHEMKSHPKRNYITKAVGVESKIEPDYYEIERNGEKTVLLCSDGLSNYCSDDEINRIIKSFPPEDAGEKLIEAALNNQGKDNITLAMIEI